MKVRILECQSGIDFVRNIGDVVEIEDEEAVRLCDCGYAEPLQPETSTKKQTKRTAVKPKVQRRDNQADNQADD